MRCLDLYERETLGSYLQDQNQERRRSWLTKLLTWPSKLVVRFYGLTMSKPERSFLPDANRPASVFLARNSLAIISSGVNYFERRLGERFTSMIMRDRK